jgi:hypothetical protein
MTNKELAIKYIEAVLEQVARERQVTQGLELVTDGSFIMCLIPPKYHTLMEDLVVSQLGSVNYEWIQWFLWESSSTRNFSIGSVEYSVEESEYKQFVDLVIE